MPSFLSRRLQAVRLHFGLNAAEMATRVGLRDRKSWERYERDETAPKAEVLAELAALGIDSHWLLTGEGGMLRTVESGPGSGCLRPGQGTVEDQDLMALLVDGIVAVYRDLAMDLPPSDLGRLAERMRADLVMAYDNPDERRVAVRGMLAHLRRNLSDTPIIGGSPCHPRRVE